MAFVTSCGWHSYSTILRSRDSGRLIFSARQHIAYMHTRAICYRPSVRPSVARVNPAKTVEVRIMKFLPYGSPVTLVFAM